MSDVIKFLKDIGNLIATLVKFAIKMIEDLVYIIKLLGEVVESIPDLIGFLPSAFGSMFMICIAIVIIYKVVGRD